jgi:hypothetical protein
LSQKFDGRQVAAAAGRKNEPNRSGAEALFNAWDRLMVAVVESASAKSTDPNGWE